VKAVLALLLAAATLAIYLYGAHGFALADPDEARYGEIAREMIDSGEWVTPRLNHVKYFEKPPLVYWATALAIVTFGPSELAVRMPTLLAGLATLLLTALLARRLYGAWTALLAAAILAAAPLFAFMAVI
jgi:4-amino-4-deoxy-L-arabinose transferase-like glycosyltransferase